MPRITFNNLDIDAVFDETEPVGLLSEAFGRSRGLHRIGDETVATVTAKYCGQTLTTDASFIVSALASADVVVGMSWIGLWRAVIADGRPARMVNGGACQREWGTASEDESITQSEINMPIVNAAHVGLNGSGPSSYGGNNVVEPSNSAFKVDRSKSILRDVLTGNHSSGIRVSAFVDSLELMNSVKLHGLQTNDLSATEIRSMFLHHLLTGGCADHYIDDQSRILPDRTACCEVCGGMRARDVSDIAVSESIVNFDQEMHQFRRESDRPCFISRSHQHQDRPDIHRAERL